MSCNVPSLAHVVPEKTEIVLKLIRSGLALPRIQAVAQRIDRHYRPALCAVFDPFRFSSRLSSCCGRHRTKWDASRLVGMNPDVLSMTQKSSLGDALGREGMHFNLETALRKYLGEAMAGNSGTP